MISLDAVGIVVADMERSLAFYRLLGLDVRNDRDGGHVEFVCPNGLRLMWDTEELVRSFAPDYEPPSRGQRIGLAFLCGDAAGVDAVCARLTAAGYPLHREPWDAFWGQRYAQAKDPDGNVVDLFAPL